MLSYQTLWPSSRSLLSGFSAMKLPPSLAIKNALPGLLFDCLDLADAADVPLCAGKTRPEKRAQDFLRERRPDDPGAEAQDVHVVVLHPLPRREGVVAEGGADSRHLVRRDAGAHTAPADEDSPLAAARSDGMADEAREVRIVRRRGVEGPHVLDRVAPLPAERGDFLLHCETRVVAADGDPHR